MAIKKVKFDYVRVCCKIYESKEKGLSDEKLFDLEELLKKASTRNSADNTYSYYGEDARLQSVIKMKDTPYWKLQFLRIRKNDMPGVATEEGKYDALELESNEWIGEEVSAFYDESMHIMMIQRNRNSLGIKGIQKYFNCALNDTKCIVELLPILLPAKYRTLNRNEIFKKIKVNFCKTAFDNEILPQGSSLLNIIKGARRFGAASVSISMSLGRGADKDESLTEEEIMFLAELTKEQGFTKIQVDKKDKEDAPLETIDLLEGKVMDEQLMEFSRENRIEYSRVIKIMESKYYDKLPLLKEIFEFK